jgi:hypothetical protein
MKGRGGEGREGRGEREKREDIVSDGWYVPLNKNYGDAIV